MPGFWKSVGNFLTGTPEKHKRVSTLMPNQQSILDNLTNSLQNEGAGGAFGNASDYYRDLLNPNGENANDFIAPQKRQFNEEIIPDLAEQFAGMGSGALTSSGFRNAGVSAGTDLAERLGAIRAQLRQQGAQGLSNLGQMGLGNYSQDVVSQPGTQGFLSQISPLIGEAASAYATGGASIPSSMSRLSNNSGVRNTSPYGGNGLGGQYQPQSSQNARY